MRTIPRFVALDSWRGICAYLVAMFHFTNSTLFLDIPFFRNAYLFVDFFFVLSGFVISANYGDRFSKGFSIKNFMILRFGRVYPLHLFTLTLFVTLALLRFGDLGQYALTPFVSEYENPYAIITNLLLIHSLGIHDNLTWNSPSWSISTEFYTYFVFAVLATLFRKYLNIILVIIVISGPIFISIFSIHYMDTTYDYGFIRCLYGFSVGSLLWWIYEKKLHNHRKNARENILLWTVIEISSVTIAISFVSSAGTTLISIFSPLVFSFVIYSFIYESGYISKLLLTKFFVIIGKMSYSIYMLHVFVQFFALKLLFTIQPLLGTELLRITNGQTILSGTLFERSAVYLLTMLLTLAFAYLTYRGIEAQGNSYFRRVVRRRVNA